MCTITATEFKTNFGKYLERALVEDILITKNGHPILTLSKTKADTWDEFVEKWNNVERFDVDESDPKISHMLGKL